MREAQTVGSRDEYSRDQQCSNITPPLQDSVAPLLPGWLPYLHLPLLQAACSVGDRHVTDTRSPIRRPQLHYLQPSPGPHQLSSSRTRIRLCLGIRRTAEARAGDCYGPWISASSGAIPPPALPSPPPKRGGRGVSQMTYHQEWASLCDEPLLAERQARHAWQTVKHWKGADDVKAV